MLPSKRKLSRWQKVGLSVFVSYIHIFCYVNLEEHSTKLKIVIFYSIMLVENILLIALWVLGEQFTTAGLADWSRDRIFISVFTSFFLGLFFMVIYYKFFHVRKLAAALEYNEQEVQEKTRKSQTHNTSYSSGDDPAVTVFNCALNPALRKKKKMPTRPVPSLPSPPNSTPFWKEPLPGEERTAGDGLSYSRTTSVDDIRQKLADKKEKQLLELRKIEDDIAAGRLERPHGGLEAGPPIPGVKRQPVLAKPPPGHWGPSSVHWEPHSGHWGPHSGHWGPSNYPEVGSYSVYPPYNDNLQLPGDQGHHSHNMEEQDQRLHHRLGDVQDHHQPPHHTTGDQVHHSHTLGDQGGPHTYSLGDAGHPLYGVRDQGHLPYGVGGEQGQQHPYSVGEQQQVHHRPYSVEQEQHPVYSLKQGTSSGYSLEQEHHNYSQGEELSNYSGRYRSYRDSSGDQGDVDSGDDLDLHPPGPPPPPRHLPRHPDLSPAPRNKDRVVIGGYSYETPL